MKNPKQLQLILFTIFMVWGIFNSYSQLVVGQDFTVNDIKYKVTSTTPAEVEAVDYTRTGTSTVADIPPTVNNNGTDYSVTSIGNDAFRDNQLTDVAIPNSVSRIGNRAFFENKVARMTLGQNVTSIGEEAFSHNRLTRVTIPNSVISIGLGAFNHNFLQNVEIPNSVTSIEDWVFSHNQLTKVTIPNSVTSIGWGAFNQNSSLSQVTMEAINPPALNANAFKNPDRDQISLIVPIGLITAYESHADWNHFKSISDGTFTANDITYVITSSSEVKIIGYTGTATAVDIPSTVNNNGTDYSVTSIGDLAFHGKQLTNVVIPEGVTHIGSAAFSNNKLTSVTIPEGVTSVSNDAFANNQLTSVILGENVTDLGVRVFFNNQLTEVNIPENVTVIRSWAFGQNPITKVSVRGTDIIPTILNIPFSNRNQIDLTTPEGKTQAYLDAGWIGFRTVIGLPKIGDEFTVSDIKYKITSTTPNEVEVVDYTGTATEVDIPSTVNGHGTDYTVTAIGDQAFNSKGLTSIDIPEGVTHIGIRAFADNHLNTSLVIPSTVASIGHTAFWNNSITSLELPEGITHIKENTFGRNNLASVTIPASVTSIEHNAFITHPNSPSPMTEIIMRGTTPPTLGEPFSGRGSIAIIVPIGSASAYGSHADWNGFRTISNGSLTIGDFTVNDITYEVINSNEVEAVDYTGTATEVDIPSTVNNNGTDYEVTGIGVRAFNEKQLTEVTIPNSVTNIAYQAFHKNALTEVTIPEGVTNLIRWGFCE